METVGERVRREREAQGMSRDELGRRIGKKYSYIAELERPEGMKGSTKLHSIAQALGVSASWLETGKGSKSPSSPSVRLTGTIILAAYREAVTKYELQGMNASSFDPLSDPDDAELLALAIIAQLSPAESDSGIQVKAEVGDGTKRKGAARSRAVGEHRSSKDGGEGGSTAGKRKKRAA